MSAATALKSQPKVLKPVTVTKLAEILGVNRQRVYALLQRGMIKSTRLSGGVVIMPEEVNRVLSSATIVDALKGPRILFDLNERI